jgi:hypothetical protein
MKGGRLPLPAREGAGGWVGRTGRGAAPNLILFRDRTITPSLSIQPTP